MITIKYTGSNIPGNIPCTKNILYSTAPALNTLDGIDNTCNTLLTCGVICLNGSKNFGAIS